MSTFIARFIRCTPSTNGETGQTFYNFGWATTLPVGEVLKASGTSPEDIAKLVASGLDMSQPATFSMAENKPILPGRVLCHLFSLENVRLVPAIDRATGTIARHRETGQPCLNGERASLNLYPKYTWNSVGGSEVAGLPPETEVQSLSTVADLPPA